MSSYPVWIEPRMHVPPPAFDAAFSLIALAPADAPLPLAPRGCRWLIHGPIAALSAFGEPELDVSSRHVLGQVPGATPVGPKPVRLNMAAMARLFERHSVALQRVLSRRARCAEYRVTVSGVAQHSDFRLFARVAQDLADLSTQLCATPTELLPIVAGDVVIALSLTVHNDRIERLVAMLDDARQIADARGLSMHVVGPDALRSFPLALSEWDGLVPVTSPEMKRAG